MDLSTIVPASRWPVAVVRPALHSPKAGSEEEECCYLMGSDGNDTITMSLTTIKELLKHVLSDKILLNMAKVMARDGETISNNQQMHVTNKVLNPPPMNTFVDCCISSNLVVQLALEVPDIGLATRQQASEVLDT